MDREFKKSLEMANKTWGKAKARAESSSYGGSDVEDGRYKASIKKAELGKSKSSGRLQVAWTYDILEGEYVGKSLMGFDGCETEDNQMWLGRKLATLGFDIPEDIDEVEEILDEITKKRMVVQISVKTKGEYQNVFVDRVLVGEEVSQEIDPSAEGGGESVPSEDNTELAEGMQVSFTLKTGEVEGEVIEILEDSDEARVDVEGKIYRVKVEKLTLLEEEPPEEPKAEDDEPVPEEPEEEPPARSRKVVKKKPSKKTVKKGKKSRR